MTTSSESRVEARPSGPSAGGPGNPSGRSRPAAGTQTRRPGGGGGGGRSGGGGGRRPWGRRKVCQFCVDHVTYIDYKSVSRIRRYISERSRMESSKRTGTCTRHQRMLRTAILRARHMALLPYAPNHVRVTAVVQVAGPAAETPPEGSDSPEGESPEGETPEAESPASEKAERSEDSEETPEAADTDDTPEADEPEADEPAADEPDESASDDPKAEEPEAEDDDDAAEGESDSDEGDVSQDGDDEDKASS